MTKHLICNQCKKYEKRIESLNQKFRDSIPDMEREIDDLKDTINKQDEEIQKLRNSLFEWQKMYADLS